MLDVHVRFDKNNLKETESLRSLIKKSFEDEYFDTNNPFYC